MKIKAPHVAGGIVLLIAAGLAYLATRSVGPVPMPPFTEARSGPLHEHLVSAAELADSPVYTPHWYPDRVAKNISAIVAHGWSAQVCDPQAAALPAENMW